MTYCVAMKLADGLVMASDSRTNAGVDHVATFCKMTVLEKPGEEVIVLLSAGNLATTQSTVSLLRRRLKTEQDNLFTQTSMYDVACLVGETLREVIERDSSKVPAQSGVDFGSSFLLGGQIAGEEPCLFNIYPQGNFIEATADTPYFQIGESKYGKPILDRVVTHETSLSEAAKCVLISFDSTIKSNVSVGLPIDLLCYHRDTLAVTEKHRVLDSNPYFQSIRRAWSEGLRSLFAQLPDPDWQ
ncbi:MAG: proteasome-type protease [Moraxellaceae bacterium]|nr:proteasome-type protease [Moraxellaceae bacterium]